MLAQTDCTRPAASIARDGTVEGYASLFGVLDQARDMVMPGAFTTSLKTRGVRRVPMLFQHDPSEPIGVWLELREDLHGLYARGRLIPEVVRARELMALLEAGTADGLSIGFRTVKSRVDPKTRIRKLEAIELWEISIVTFPLLPGARVRAVKGDGQRGSLLSHPPRSREGRPMPRTRNARPLDASLTRFQPERFFRQQPRFRFDGGDERLSWRDLILPEHALRKAARGCEA